MGLFDLFKKKEQKQVIQSTVPQVMVSNDVRPVEKRLQGTQPSCDSLYPHEVLILSYAEGYNISTTEFPRFWWYQYGIKDVQTILKKLHRAGFITVGNTADALSLNKLPALKSILQEKGLKVSGKKEELIQRILENVSENELNYRCPAKPFKLTEAGREIIKKFEWIPYIHHHNIDGLDIWNLTQMVQTPPYVKYRDKIWGYLNKQSSDCAVAGNWGLYRNTRFQMSQFLKEENRTEEALNLLCEVASYDLSGVANAFQPELLAQQYEFFYPYDNSTVKMASGITDDISILSDSLGWSENQLFEELRRNFDKYSVQFSIFTSEEKAKIVIAEINKDTEMLKRLYIESQRRFKKQYLR